MPKESLCESNSHGRRKRCRVAAFTLYNLRHTWATRAAESGVDLVTLAAMLRKTFSGKDGKYGNKDKKIVSVEVRYNNTNQTQHVNIPADGKCTIRITTR